MRDSANPRDQNPLKFVHHKRIVMVLRCGAAASYLATEAKDPPTAKWLEGMRKHPNVWRRLCAGEDVNVCGTSGVRALHIAAKYGAMEQLKHLLEDGADPSLRSSLGYTALDYAHIFQQTEAVCCIIIHTGIVMELTAQLARTPTQEELFLATNDVAFRQFREEIQHRVETQGASFVKAARRGDLETVRTMIESKEVHVDDVRHATGETAFSAALTSGRLEMCEYLLACGAHTHAACIMDDGLVLPALVVAVRLGDVDFVKRLVWRCTGNKLRTPPHGLKTCALLEAIKLSSIPMVDALFELNEPIYTYRLENRLKMPPHVTLRSRDYVSADKRSWLVLFFACWLEDLRLVQHLLATRRVLQDPTEMAKNGAYALYLGVCRENEPIVSLFVERGASINQRLEGGKSALGAAVAIKSLRMLQLLLVHRAQVAGAYQLRSCDKAMSLLAFSVRFGAVQCARALLPLETDATTRDEALCEAVKRRHFELAQLLLSEAMPSTQQVLIACVEEATCPVMLDLLLSRCCAETFPISILESTFVSACKRKASHDILSVFLAHGVISPFAFSWRRDAVGRKLT